MVASSVVPYYFILSIKNTILFSSSNKMDLFFVNRER